MLLKLSGPEVYARIHESKVDLHAIFATGYSPDLALLQKFRSRDSPCSGSPIHPVYWHGACVKPSISALTPCPATRSQLGPRCESDIDIDTSDGTVIRMDDTWHRLNAGLSERSGTGTPKSRWVTGNKPHPPREVGAYGSYLPFLFRCEISSAASAARDALCLTAHLHGLDSQL
jgi:hypothetical protein